jgi:hypothetical protein
MHSPGNSFKYPGFKGELPFDLTFTFLGKSVTRKAKVVYEHTPEWPYSDLRKQARRRTARAGSIVWCWRALDGTAGAPPIKLNPKKIATRPSPWTHGKDQGFNVLASRNPV